jgi:hypothetical protein
MRFGHKARQLESRDCLLTRHRWKTFEKLVQRITSFEVVIQRPERHTCSDEDRCAAKNLRVAVHDERFAGPS